VGAGAGPGAGGGTVRVAVAVAAEAMDRTAGGPLGRERLERVAGILVAVAAGIIIEGD
jgi:hypothetical protein